MIKINLLSPADKNNFKWEKTNNLIKGCTLWMLLAQVVFALVFLSALEYLKMEKNILAENLEQVKSQQETKERDEIDRSLSDYAKKIDSIAGLKEQHLHWSYVLEEIISITPDGVRLENISSNVFVANNPKKESSNADRFRIDLTGNAITRKDLLIFEEKLKSSKLFSDIECDDSNYVKSSDIDFRYSLSVYKNQLLQ